MHYERVQKSGLQSKIQKKQSKIAPPPIDQQTQADSLSSPKLNTSKLPSKEQREAIKRKLFNISNGQESSDYREMPIQTKLTIGEPGDKYEQEADRVAAQVVNQINSPAPVQLDQTQSVQREATLGEEKLQMKPIVQLQHSDGDMTATPDVKVSIQQARGGGQLHSFGVVQRVQPVEQVNEQPQEEDIFASYPELAETVQEDIDRLISSGVSRNKLKTILDNCKQKGIKISPDEKSYNVNNLIKGLSIGFSSEAKNLINDVSNKPIMEEIIEALSMGGTNFQSAFECVAYATYKNRWEPNLFKTIFKAIVLHEHLTVPRAFKDENESVDENGFKEFSQDYRNLLKPYSKNPEEIKIQGSANMDIPGKVKDIDIAILKNEGDFYEDMKKGYNNAILKALVTLGRRDKNNQKEITNDDFQAVIQATRDNSNSISNSQLRSLVYCFDRGVIKNSTFMTTQDKKTRDALDKKWMPKLRLEQTTDISIILKGSQFDKPPYITLAALE